MFINFSKTPPKKAFPVQTSEGVIKKILVRGLIFDCFRCLPSERKIYLQIGGCKMPLPVQTSEGSFYNAEIIKESKTRMEFFHKSRNSQKNIQQPLSQMQKQMQAEPQGNRCFLPEVQIQKRCKKR